MEAIHNKYLILLLSGLLSLATQSVSARDATLRRSVDGVDIYMGIIHAQPAAKEATDKETGIIKTLRRKKHHITVALFDSNTGQRITDARVVASVGEMGLSSNHKRLKSERYGEAVSYGRDFYLSKTGPYWIDLKITRSGVKQATTTRFEWEHY